MEHIREHLDKKDRGRTNVLNYRNLSTFVSPLIKKTDGEQIAEFFTINNKPISISFKNKK